MKSPLIPRYIEILHTQLNDCIYILYEIKLINVMKRNKRVIQKRDAEALGNIRSHIGVQY